MAYTELGASASGVSGVFRGGGRRRRTRLVVVLNGRGRAEPTWIYEELYQSGVHGPDVIQAFFEQPAGERKAGVKRREEGGGVSSCLAFLLRVLQRCIPRLIPTTSSVFFFLSEKTVGSAVLKRFTPTVHDRAGGWLESWKWCSRLVSRGKYTLISGDKSGL